MIDKILEKEPGLQSVIDYALGMNRPDVYYYEVWSEIKPMLNKYIGWHSTGAFTDSKYWEYIAEYFYELCDETK